MDIRTTAVESPKDFGTGPQAECARWQTEIKLAEAEVEKWLTRGDKIVARYKDERETAAEKDHKINILWSNIQTMAPAVYAAAPKPEIERRYKDADPLGRAASQILERATSYCLSCCQDFDAVAKAAVLDYLLVGRGTAWERYVPHFRTVTPQITLRQRMDSAEVQDDGTQIGGESDVDLGSEDDAQEGQRYETLTGQPVDPTKVKQGDGGPYMEGEPYEETEYEETVTDYVHWKDFLHNPARYWGEVRWVARKAYLTRAELVERFGKDIGSAVPLDFVPKGIPEKTTGTEYDAYKKATVLEIWDKPSKTVYWIAKGYNQGLLDKREDPLGLSSFFPCPKPMYGTLANDKLVPVPDFALYQDQADELDTLSKRITLLSDALKVAGVYDSTQAGLQRLLQSGVENTLIPVDTWGAFAQAGGMQGVMQFLPIKEIAEVLQQLYVARKAVKDEIFEITGLSDIIRGQGMASETATAQRIKGQFASLRLRDRQGEVARFMRDVVRIKSEIIAEHFTDQTLALVSGAELMGPDGQMFAQALQLMRDDGIRNFRLDIETDSTIAADEQAEKQQVAEFLGSVGKFLQQALPAGQQTPELIPMFGEMLMFGARRYRAGRALESSIEQGMAAIQQRVQQAQHAPPKPDPKVEAERQKIELQAQAQQQKTQGDLQEQQARAQADIAIAQQKAQGEMQIEQTRAQHDMALDEARMQHQAQLETQKAAVGAQVQMAKAQQPTGPWWPEPTQ